MIPRYGRPPEGTRSYRRRPGVYAILPGSEGLLMTWQSAPHEEIQLPGGGIDPGEHPITALHREVREETGWTIANPRLYRVYRRFTYMPEYDKWAEKICSIYIARPVRRLGPPTEAGHLALWLEPSLGVDLLASEGDRAVLASWLA